MRKDKRIVIYQAKTGAIEFKEDVFAETIWATQAQIAQVFEIDQSVVSRHVKNIFKAKEVNVKSNMQKMHIPNSDKLVALYSLDVVLSIGYRANSGKAIQFRQWATKTLRSHIVEGYTINKKRINKNYKAFLKAVEQVKALLPSSNSVGASDALELIKMFAGTWFSLNAYDKENFPKTGATRKEFQFTAQELNNALRDLKAELTKIGEISGLFGIENKKQGIEGILGNVLQSFGGKDLYPTIEEKAAHLLYFIVKNHPLIDGNKRSGAFAFVWFLRKVGRLNIASMTPEALTVLTLLVAESNPKDKEKIIGLILLILK
ncbi:MAG: death-on-curing family protein [Candidatus Peregrinibacteria bacterium GW2011_GWC2_39_14]|nr:MAG: RhuM [Candidatus Peregrinibacteria bacterium GW2011_GWA2_38_36]KKR05019.1 MAG: death-on-curing family protein [Candidatus Peregrinibacteria bacterium GW2011_GWC2_39_14]